MTDNVAEKLYAVSIHCRRKLREQLWSFRVSGEGGFILADAEIDAGYGSVVPISAPSLSKAREVAREKANGLYPEEEGYYGHMMVAVEISVGQLRYHGYVKYLEEAASLDPNIIREWLSEDVEYGADGENIISVSLGGFGGPGLTNSD